MEAPLLKYKEDVEVSDVIRFLYVNKSKQKLIFFYPTMSYSLINDIRIPFQFKISYIIDNVWFSEVV